jgi:hypothetical protein
MLAAVMGDTSPASSVGAVWLLGVVDRLGDTAAGGRVVELGDVAAYLVVAVSLGAAAVLDVIDEEFILNFAGRYVYYGNQPLILISKLPWWWIPCNSIGVFLAASITYRLRDYLQGWRSLAVFFVTPLSVSAVYGAIALPSFIVTNGDYPWLPTQLCGLLTLAQGVMLFAGILKPRSRRGADEVRQRSGRGYRSCR